MALWSPVSFVFSRAGAWGATQSAWYSVCPVIIELPSLSHTLYSVFLWFCSLLPFASWLAVLRPSLPVGHRKECYAVGCHHACGLSVAVLGYLQPEAPPLRRHHSPVVPPSHPRQGLATVSQKCSVCNLGSGEAAGLCQDPPLRRPEPVMENGHVLKTQTCRSNGGRGRVKSMDRELQKCHRKWNYAPVAVHTHTHPNFWNVCIIFLITWIFSESFEKKKSLVQILWGIPSHPPLWTVSWSVSRSLSCFGRVWISEFQLEREQVLPQGLLEISGVHLLITGTGECHQHVVSRGPKRCQNEGNSTQGRLVLSQVPVASPLGNTGHRDENFRFLGHLYCADELR